MPVKALRDLPRRTIVLLILALAVVLVGGSALASGAGANTSATYSASKTKPASKPTIVLVHGAFADASGWNGVTARLQQRGYRVVAWANPMRALASDAEALSTFLSTITGPVVLVGHSYGGAVITQVSGNSEVKALVYVTGYALDQGENVFAASALGGAHSTLGDHLMFRPIAGSGPENADAYVDPAYFRGLLAGDLGKARTAVLAASQRPAAVAAFASPSGAPAWKTIPSYYLIATRDNAIPKEAQSAMAERAGAKTTNVAGSHFVMLSHPGAVAEFVSEAATGH
jgi:pimeloyl-ACP methyl ester carboxylesterase